MRKQILQLGLALAMGVGCISQAFSQVKPEILVEQRPAGMVMMAKYMYSIVPMAMGRVPYDAATVTRNVGYLEVLSKMPWDGFTPATADVKNTKALPAIYADPAKFKAAQDNFQAELAKLIAATKGGNEAAIKTAIVDANTKGCNGCHNDFRAKQQ
jgi:cytochrome c556